MKKPWVFYGWVIVAVTFVTLVLGYTIRNSFSVFYPAIVEEFGWGRGNTALMFSIALLVYGFVAPWAGRLVDRFSPRLVLPVGACIAGVGIALCSLAATPWQFYLFYGVVAAAGLSLMGWTPITVIISNWFVKKRGLVYGILGAGFGGSLMAASPAQVLISRFGWQTAYIITGVVAVAVIVPLCSLLIRRAPRDKGLLPDGATPRSSPAGDPDGPRAAASPQTKWSGTDWTLSRAMKTYQFWLLFFIAFNLLGFAETTAIAHQIYFFRDVGYAPIPAAQIYSVFGLAFMLGNLGSYLSDRFGRERVFMPSCLLAIAGVSLLFLMGDASHPWMPLLFAVSFGLGIGAAVPVFFTAVADLFQGSNFGSIQGTMILGFSLGGALAPWLAGFLYDMTGSYFTTFLIIMGSLIASMVMMRLVAPGKLSPVSGGS
ncbi:MAG: MFS transporter [Dehalococcoidia bacterium]